ncbi:MAG: type II toxin-antitoxin system PemK/MazF family toxin [Propionibacteriales bacterium]|nr:type II toxin-antitoxin system PemK/MazF family toxin [Propionibacteriales bacterium]
MIVRGRIVWAIIDEVIGRKPYLVVSNNPRNQAMQSFLAIRITTSRKPTIPTVVELPPGEPVDGYVLCDELMMLWQDEVSGDVGALSPATMSRVDQGLKHALALRA